MGRLCVMQWVRFGMATAQNLKAGGLVSAWQRAGVLLPVRPALAAVRVEPAANVKPRALGALPAFTPASLIATDQGEVAVEALQPGDRVLTRDHGYQPVLWAGGCTLAAAEIGVRPALAPLRIAAGALGPGLPERDMIVSPRQQLLFCGTQAELLFGEHEVLIAAHHLEGRAGIARMPTGAVRYLDLLLGRAEILRCDGVWSASCQPGIATLAAMDAKTRREILVQCPDVARGAGFESPRLTLRRHEAGLLSLV